MSEKTSKTLTILSYVLSVAVCLLLAACLLKTQKRSAVEMEKDLIMAHPHSLSVTILKNIFEAMEPYFSLEEIDRKWFFNDLYEIESKEIDLFYVPK